MSENVAKGDYVFLRPEDVGGRSDQGVYAKVTSVTNCSVGVTTVGESAAEASFVVSKTVANARQVSKEEATIERQRMCLRKAVACVDGKVVRFGQVVKVSTETIALCVGDIVVDLPLAAMQCVVHPLTAMLLMGEPLTTDDWPQARIEAADRALGACFETPFGVKVHCPPSLDDVRDVVDASLTVTEDTVRQWTEVQSGKQCATTIRHAILFTYFVEHVHPASFTIRTQLGHSIANDPMVPTVGSLASAVSKRRRDDLEEMVELDAEEEEEEKTSRVATLQPPRQRQATGAGGVPPRATRAPQFSCGPATADVR